MERKYTVVGSQPVRKPGTKEYAEPGSTFTAKPEDVAFFLQIGAVKETTAVTPPRGANKRS